MKLILIVLDSVGIGEAPDASAYGDTGACTLQHLAEACGGLHVPAMAAMGLGNIPQILPAKKSIPGVQPVITPLASFGAMREVSEGKDTITGHWEIGGLKIIPGFHQFPEGPSFPPEMLHEFERLTGRACMGDKAASGTDIIREMGQEASESGKWIVYTSADSVFQIAANVDVIPLQELYQACETARKLCDPLKVGRVIARPFIGNPGNYTRTEDRRDYAYTPEQRTILEHCSGNGIPVYGVGKIEDIFAHRGLTWSNHTGNTHDSQNEVARLTCEEKDGFIFANFIDFDMLYGHRRDAQGYAKALETTDVWFKDYLSILSKDDVLLITADHGNDPTYKGSDHTREYVPLLVYQAGRPGCNLGIRQGFYDIAQSIATFFRLPPMPYGVSFL